MEPREKEKRGEIDNISRERKEVKNKGKGK
jgi:hypothetical protein